MLVVYVFIHALRLIIKLISDKHSMASPLVGPLDCFLRIYTLNASLNGLNAGKSVVIVRPERLPLMLSISVAPK